MSRCCYQDQEGIQLAGFLPDDAHLEPAVTLASWRKIAKQVKHQIRATAGERADFRVARGHDGLMNDWFADGRGRVIQFETTATYATSLGTVTCTCPPE
jgi:hypothetical protein